MPTEAEERIDKVGPKFSIVTKYGKFIIELYKYNAPISAENFIRRVKLNLFDKSTFYRVVTMKNQPDSVPAKIEVVQFGYPTVLALKEGILPPIEHETTAKTGLRHLDGTLSMARMEPGTASSAFFICIGDQPELDFNGGRNPDGQGFAAFGRVVKGMSVVRTIFAQADPETDLLSDPIPITAVNRIA